jgi:uncharacterized protein (TIGR00299 family) protein
MIAYFDCSSGISGDMVLGALIDAGVSPSVLKRELSRLPVKGYTLHFKTVKRSGMKASKADVKTLGKSAQRVARRFKDIQKIVEKSSLSKGIKTKGLTIFKRLFQAEAQVHGKRFEQIHLHELGAVDCLIDIFGALIGLDLLKVKKVYASPLNVGSGTVKTEHGILPLPPPATAELLKNIPVYSSDINFELTTPTGAVIISTLADSFGPMPEIAVSQIGAGAGRRDFEKQPNVLRLFVGRSIKNRQRKTEIKNRQSDNNILVVETNIDDMNPQIYEYVINKILKSGALDVFLTPVIMKKSRPGIKLTVLCNEDRRDGIVKVILEETTSIGKRTNKSVNTKFGRVPVKVSHVGADVKRITPEYDYCRKLAKKHNAPLLEIIEEARLKAAAKKG